MNNLFSCNCVMRIIFNEQHLYNIIACNILSMVLKHIKLLYLH